MSDDAWALLCKCTHLSSHLHQWPRMEILFTVSMNHNNSRRARLGNWNGVETEIEGGSMNAHISSQIESETVIISLSLIPVVLQSCIILQSEKHIKPLLFIEAPRSQFYVWNIKCKHQANALTSKALNVLENSFSHLLTSQQWTSTTSRYIFVVPFSSALFCLNHSHSCMPQLHQETQHSGVFSR